MATINNFAEFMKMILGEDGDAPNAMYRYGRGLYKGSAGFWTCFVVEDAPAEEIPYKIFIYKNKEGKMRFNTFGIPAEVLHFFSLGTGNNGAYVNASFESYYELLEGFDSAMDDEKSIGQNFKVSRRNDAIMIVGTYYRGATESEVYYESVEAREESHILASDCIGIKIGSIIEGADYDATPFRLDFPFTTEEFQHRLDDLRMEVEYEWELNNSEESDFSD